jgi:serine/threonine protein kinase
MACIDTPGKAILITLQFVRKELLPHDQNQVEVDYDTELRNLSLLNNLKHPNIVELLSAYSYRGTHNLIFPRARGGDLATFFKKEHPLEFQTVEAFLVALSGLASAIEQVHNFTSHTLDLEMIGCHHDLKPGNILVDGSSFILADFGLSRLKGRSESSNTPYRMGHGDYLAPEIEDLSDPFQKNCIRRSSDIWSFGCIIAEVLTHMIQGPSGVQEFWVKRAFKVETMLYHRFHNGPNRPSTEVSTWLLTLESPHLRTRQLLLRLIRNMLSICPSQRPTAKEVTNQLQFIALTELAQPINALYSEISSQSDSFEAIIERMRFQSWMQSYGICDPDGDLCSSLPEVKLDFQPTIDTLFRIRDELEAIAPTCRTAQDRVFSPLRHLNNRIRDLLPSALREKMQRHMEYDIIKTIDLGTLEKTRRAFEDRSSDTKIGLLASIKRMTIMAMERSESYATGLMLDPMQIEHQGSLAGFDVALMKEADPSRTRRVVVEWMRYDTPLLTELVGNERLVRVEAIAELLNSTKTPEDFRVLHCCGYFHDHSKCRFGLVFDFPYLPLPSGEGFSDPVTLRTMLDSSEHQRKRPILGDRFKLALALAMSIVEFHKVGWLHKNISSSNVVFFPRDSSSVDHFTQPYITGFGYSRPDEPCAFTEGPAEGSDYKYYQDPEYLKNQLRYRHDFDYFSLGIVFLEIGLWKSLKSVTKGWDGPPEELCKQLLKRRVPLLKYSMGVRFFDVVNICLTGDWGISRPPEDTNESRMALCLRFEKLVIEKLAECLV